MKKYILFTLCGMLGLLIGHYQSMAADPMGKKPILDRMFHEFTPKGLKLGSFTVLPSLDTGIEYTSNTLKSNTNEISERVLRAKVNIDATSLGDNHEFNVKASGERLDYQKTDDFDQTNFSGFAGFKYELSKNIQGRLKAAFIRSHQTEYDNGTIAVDYAPVQVDNYGVGGGLTLTSNNIQWDLDGDYRQTRYDNTDRINGGTLIQEDRDKDIYKADVRASLLKFKSDGRYIPFMGLTTTRSEFLNRDYVAATSRFSGVEQSNSQYEGYVGVDLGEGNKLQGSARVGYGLYDPDDNDLDRRQTGLVDIDLTYLYTPLTNFTLNANRFFTDDNDAVGGTLQTRLSAGIIHELTRRWILTSELAYMDRSFDQNGDDTTWEGGLGFVHRLNDRFDINGDIKYISRESNQEDGDYSETRAMVRVRSKF